MTASRPAVASRMAVGPAGSPQWVVDAVVAGGGVIVGIPEADALVWASPRDVEGLRAAIGTNPSLTWVQVPFAGVENYLDVFDSDRTWTCGKGVYAEPVAEHALALALAGMRNVGSYARAGSWTGPKGRNLLGAKVTILGGGGITESLLRLLSPFGCDVTVVRRTVEHVEGAREVVGPERLIDALVGADLVVLALALTDETRGIISRDELGQMETHAWIVNVARGAHIVTDDLVWALDNGVIAGAALDVTDPEPLPPGHRLWSMDNCIITPHIGNTPEMAVPLLSARITENVRRHIAGEPLVGLVDVDAGY